MTAFIIDIASSRGLAQVVFWRYHILTDFVCFPNVSIKVLSTIGALVFMYVEFGLSHYGSSGVPR